jgi:hypothetical protein
MEQTEWGLYPHWFGTFARPVCKICHDMEAVTVSQYEIQIWLRDSNENDIYCIGCFEILIDARPDLAREARKNIELGILMASDKFEDELTQILSIFHGKEKEEQ